jgi:hypothetical protein
MLKTKIFHFLAKGNADPPTQQAVNIFLKERNEHDDEISKFIEHLSKQGHTFINMSSVSYGRFENNNRIRTIIIYFENPTRNVIFEKLKK